MGPVVTEVTLLEEGAYLGAEVSADGKTYQVLFAKAGDPGGTVRVMEGGSTVLDQYLTTDVQAQRRYGAQ